MNRHWSIPAILGASLLAAAGGCMNSDPTKGWTTVSPYRPGIKTVAVPVWNRGAGEFRRDLEIRLTEAIKKRIQGEGAYQLAADREHADTLLTGTLKSVKQHVMSFNPKQGTAREIQVTISVDFIWTDLRTGQVLVEKKDFHATAGYIPVPWTTGSIPPPDGGLAGQAPFGEDFFQGSEDALDRLALSIVQQMQQPW